MDAALAFARLTAETTFDRIDPAVVEVTKFSVLDTLGVMLAASGAEPACGAVVELAQESGGRPESTILAFGGKVPAAMAAMANGALGHALDYDEAITGAFVHPSPSTLPAALAVAERRGSGGKEFLAAMVLGNDMTARLGHAMTRTVMEHGWLIPQLFGTFGATAAAGKLLHLSQDQMADAFGIALQQAAGSMEVIFSTGSVLRAIRDGFAATAGVLSALLAEKGICGVRDSLEGRSGLFNLYFRGEYKPERLTADLGHVFAGARACFKPWPACRETHTAIEATLSLVNEHNIHSDDVASVIVSTGPSWRPLFEPAEDRRNPKLSIDAKESLPFAVGLALARGRVSIGDYLQENLSDPAVLRAVAKVQPRFDPQLDGMADAAVVVEIQLKDGGSYAKEVTVPYGDPPRPMSSSDIVAKFRDCLAYSIRPLTGAEVDAVIEMVLHLEQVGDIRDLTAKLG